jgi:hypothetical protein
MLDINYLVIMIELWRELIVNRFDFFLLSRHGLDKQLLHGHRLSFARGFDLL